MATSLILLTQAAADRAKAMLTQRGTPEAFLRVGVKTAGCSGLAYKLEYADTPQPGDEVFESNGVKVVVDAKSVLYLAGLQMDYQVEALKSGFVFNNPNKKGECGCGESFTV
jgi:iron-sulfur cluster assembly protein